MADATDTEAPSRRQEHKLRTERALQQAALELFAKQGYDETTTEEVAERAGVSPRTFFRYFATKESVLFAGEYIFLQSFTKHFLEQPRSLSDIEAMKATLRELSPRLTKTRRSLALYERAVASSPTLRGGVLDHQADAIATTAEAIATRRGLDEPDEACVLLATVALITYRRSVMNWLAGPASVDPADAITTQFDLLVSELSPNGSSRRRNSR